MKCVVGTNNKSKITIVAKVLTEFNVQGDISVNGININSGVPDTPWGEEIKQGAYNRATVLANTHKGIHCIGIESGLVTRYGDTFEESWACVIVNTKVFYGYSSGLLIPKYVLNRMKQDAQEHGPAMNTIRTELNQHDDRDTWGTYSAKLITRDVSLAEALRNALIQVFAPEESLYRKS